MKSNLGFTFPEKGSWSHLPTPIEPLYRVSEELGIEVHVKRDDFTGFEWSGNKIRKLDFLLHDALKQGASTVATCGGIQSNHCRATAALAAKLGLRCVLLLRGEKPKDLAANFLLDKLFGAEVHFLTDDQYYNGMQDIRMAIDSQIRAQGGKFYFIPEGGSNALGAMGYANAWQEIGGQLGANEPYSSIIVAHGSGGTHAGLILGKILAGDHSLDQTNIHAVNVCYDKQRSFLCTKDVLWSAIQNYKIPISFFGDDIKILDGFVGIGYAKNTEAELEFIAKIARTEGLLLDPTYSGKAFYGFFQTAKKAKEYFGKKVLFIHTGGTFGNFKVGEAWNAVLD